jgi:CheY-like chemotaxis protein
LNFVRTAVESWDGELAITSPGLGGGTQVTLTIPLTKRPGWFASELMIPEDSTIVILDDDPSIHQVWKSRLSTLVARGKALPGLNFSSADEMRDGVNRLKQDRLAARQAMYLCDYELAGGSVTGLDLIEQLDIAQQAILVTSYFDDPGVIEKCNRLGCRIIPKSFADSIPIKIVKQPLRPDCILIDDDAIVHQTWQASAKRHDKTIKRFFCVEEFLSVSDEYDKLTPVYVDSDLGEGGKGEDMAKYIHFSGFRALYLQTGFPSESFGQPLPWIKEIVSKMPPWELKA